jgi:hypothetical protein
LKKITTSVQRTPTTLQLSAVRWRAETMRPSLHQINKNMHCHQMPALDHLAPLCFLVTHSFCFFFFFFVLPFLFLHNFFFFFSQSDLRFQFRCKLSSSTPIQSSQMCIQSSCSARVIERAVCDAIRARQFQMRHGGVERVLLSWMCASKSMHCAICRIVQLTSTLFERVRKKPPIKRHVVRHQRTVANKLYKRSQHL